MIGPGWLPRPPRLRVRALAYTRVRRRPARRRNRAHVPRPTEPIAHEPVTFDHGPSEFPVAIVRPRDPGGHAVALLGDLRRWLAAFAAWLRPRTVPVLVAALGAMFALATMKYLAPASAGGPAAAETAAPAPGVVLR